MASIVDYFNSKPTSIGSSTFQLDNLTSNKLKDDLTLSNYQTLIGSVDTNFENAFEQGTNNKYSALLLHAADIFWGDAVLTNAAAINKLSEINLYKTNRIRTSRDIIAILEYLLAHIGDVPNTPTEFSISPTSASLSESKQYETFTAKLSGGSIVGSNVQWNLSFVSGSSNLKLDSTTGESTIVRRINAPTANKGTISLPSAWTTNESAGTASITPTFTTGASSNLSCNYTLTATYNGESKTASISYTGSASSLTEGTYNWSINGSLPANITASSTTSKTLTLTNSSTSPINVTATWTCSNTNATNTVTTITVTVPPKSQQKQYYYLASWVGQGGVVPNMSWIESEVFNEFPCTAGSKVNLKSYIKDNLTTNLHNITGIKQSTSNTDSSWIDSYEDGKIDLGNAILFYSFVLAPKAWVDKVGSGNILKGELGDINKQATIEFTYNGDTYNIIASESTQSAGSVKPNIYIVQQ